MSLPDTSKHTYAQPVPATLTEHILSVLSDGVIAVNQHGEIIFINEAACRLIGCQYKQVLHKPLSSVFRLRSNLQQLDAEFLQHLIQQQITMSPITRQELITQQDSKLLIDYSISPLNGESALLLFHDISHVPHRGRTMLYQVSSDPLTRLPNREVIQQSLNQLHGQHAPKRANYAILLCDLDRFKLINDSYGHAIGDEVLKSLSSQISKTIRPQDNLGRWGGEEFICLLPDTSIQEAVEVAERLRTNISATPLELKNGNIDVSASIGIASYPHDGCSMEEILRVADAMLYEAKRKGRNRACSSLNQSGNILAIASQLETALKEEQIVAAYQPIVDLGSGEQVAQEVLARIVNCDNTVIEAGHFIDAAVHLQMAHKIDHIITRQAILHCNSAIIGGSVPVPHFVNISVDMLRHPDLVTDILQTAMLQCQAYSDITGRHKPIVIEITEQELLHDINKAKRILAPFLDFGFRLAIDDFGSGYTSLHYLADLPVSFLKIDGSLVKRIALDKRVRSILLGIQNMADDLELVTIAECIENEATLDALRCIGVEWGQGFYFGKPGLR